MEEEITERRDPSVTVAGLIIILLLLFLGAIAAGMNMYNYHQREEILSAKDKTIIQRELLRIGANDCVLERTGYGYTCKEIKSGKKFKIKL